MNCALPSRKKVAPPVPHFCPHPSAHKRHQLVIEPREIALVDGDDAGIQAGDAVGVDVGADYFVARFREARGGDQAHIPTANHRKMQANSPEPE